MLKRSIISFYKFENKLSGIEDKGLKWEYITVNLHM